MTDLDRAILNGFRIDTTHGAGVSYLTQKQEYQQAVDCGFERVWTRTVRNRVAFRHDETRGPASHTLTHAVY